MLLGPGLLRNRHAVFRYHIKQRLRRVAHLLLERHWLLPRHTDPLQPVHHQRNLLAFDNRGDNRMLLVERRDDLFRDANPVQSAHAGELHESSRLHPQHHLVVAEVLRTASVARRRHTGMWSECRGTRALVRLARGCAV
jgi:hypothetical protein